MKDLKFASDLEKQSFIKYFRDKDRSSLTTLLLSTDAALTVEKDAVVRNQINALGNSLTISGIQKRKPQRKVKEIYDFIHRTTLKKYELECRFDQIIPTGVYNCVTATALYALIFDDLKIPYEIKEKPTHVYLLAYPNVDNIVVETTSPLFGYLTFDDTYKQKFVTILKDQKIIGSEDLAKKSTEELFNQYYFISENIDLPKLVGIHYMNDAIFKKDKDRVEEAYRQLEKSYLFYPSPRCQFLLMNFGADAMARAKLEPKEKAILLSKIARYRDEGITVDMIKGEFHRLGQEVLFRNNNKQLYKACYDLFIEGQNKEVSDEISFIYFYENGRAFYNQDNYVQAKSYFEKALRIQPNNVDLNKIFVGVLAQNFQRIKKNGALLDSLSYYRSHYPVLTQYNSFNSMFGSANLAQFQDEFEKGDPVKGNKCRAIFEEDRKLHPDLNLSEYEIGNAYGAAFSYYSRKGKRAQADEALKKGLELSPDNYLLKQYVRTSGK